MNLEEHKKIGQTLRWLQYELYNMNSKYRYKKDKRKSYESKCVILVSNLRCMLDNVVCRDYPIDWEGVYYGKCKPKLFNQVVKSDL